MCLIPKKIYQSWKTKEVPEQFKANVQKLKELNPDYEYYLYDDDDCRQYLKKNYSPLHAFLFDNLIHGAFKCDFWRYAILAKEGGIYIDLDDVPVVPFDEIIGKNDTFVSIVDRKNVRSIGPCGIYQAFLACSPDNSIMKISLDISFYNLINQKQITGTGPLDITGPVVVGRALNLHWGNILSTQEIKAGRYDGGIVLFQNDMALSCVTDENGKKIIECKSGVDLSYILAPTYYGHAKRFYKFGNYPSHNIISFIEFYIVFALILLFSVLFVTPNYRQFILWSLLAIFFIFSFIFIDHKTETSFDNYLIHTIYDGKLKPDKVDTKIRQIYPYSQILVWTPELIKHFKSLYNLNDIDDNDIGIEIVKHMGGKVFDLKSNTLLH
jgi:hypothetical protein